MIIDADTHISPENDGADCITYEKLIEMMDYSGVDKAIAWLKPPYMRETDNSNRYIYEAMKKNPERILGFGWADPHLGINKAKDTIKRCFEEYGFYGVKLNGAQNEFLIDDPKISLPLIEEINRFGKPAAFHVGGDFYENTHPSRIGKIAKKFPELKILMVHMGGASFKGTSISAIETAEAYPNTILIGSAVKSIHILNAVRKLGASRVCYGSDTPFEFMHVEVAKYQALFKDQVNTADMAKIMGENIKKFINA
ncbi:MAG: amidohydrolase family protein [Treponema sp.]|nr:amidohydrolase family protein [Treponema sp.]